MKRFKNTESAQLWNLALILMSGQPWKCAVKWAERTAEKKSARQVCQLVDFCRKVSGEKAACSGRWLVFVFQSFYWHLETHIYKRHHSQATTVFSFLIYVSEWCYRTLWNIERSVIVVDFEK